jgi:hypothetical protein
LSRDIQDRNDRSIARTMEPMIVLNCTSHKPNTFDERNNQTKLT